MPRRGKALAPRRDRENDMNHTKAYQVIHAGVAAVIAGVLYGWMSTTASGPSNVALQAQEGRHAKLELKFRRGDDHQVLGCLVINDDAAVDVRRHVQYRFCHDDTERPITCEEQDGTPLWREATLTRWDTCFVRSVRYYVTQTWTTDDMPEGFRSVQWRIGSNPQPAKECDVPEEQSPSYLLERDDGLNERWEQESCHCTDPRPYQCVFFHGQVIAREPTTQRWIDYYIRCPEEKPTQPPIPTATVRITYTPEPRLPTITPVVLATNTVTPSPTPSPEPTARPEWTVYLAALAADDGLGESPAIDP